MNHAPLALFCYRRPEHLRTTLRSLARNPEASQSALIAFCDGPKSSDPQLLEAIAAVQKVLREFESAFQSLEIVKRETNYGLAKNIIHGVTDVVNRYGRVIVIEDDLLCSPGFLKYLNDGLTLYADDAAVASIHAYVVPLARGEYPETFFLRGADCWGWATWKRAWEEFRADGAALLEELESGGLKRRFDLDGTYEYTAMLREQVAGRNNSCAIRWHASAFLANRLTLYPGRSLVQNIGLDGSGTHCGTDETPNWNEVAAEIPVRRIPVQENQVARAALVAHYRSAQAAGTGWVQRARRLAKRVIGAK